jgi:hypothetical protein
VTRAQLESLRAANALPHTLRYNQLAPYHVPFDELCGGTAVEGELAHWLAHRGRVSLIGPSGSGKSSALAWVLDHRTPENLAILNGKVDRAVSGLIARDSGCSRAPDSLPLIRPLTSSSSLGLCSSLSLYREVFS